MKKYNDIQKRESYRKMDSQVANYQQGFPSNKIRPSKLLQKDLVPNAQKRNIESKYLTRDQT